MSEMSTRSPDRHKSGFRNIFTRRLWEPEESTPSEEAIKTVTSVNNNNDFKEGQSSVIPDHPGLRMPEESNWLTARFGLWDTQSQSKSNVSSTSRESFKKDQSKEEIIDYISFFKGQSSSIPVPKRPESPDLSISDGNNSSTGSLELWEKKRKKGSAESLSQSFESDQSKEDVINFKDEQFSPIPVSMRPESLDLSISDGSNSSTGSLELWDKRRQWKSVRSSTFTESFESDWSTEEVINFKDGRSSPMLDQIRELLLQPGFIRTGEAI